MASFQKNGVPASLSIPPIEKISPRPTSYPSKTRPTTELMIFFFYKNLSPRIAARFIIAVRYFSWYNIYIPAKSKNLPQ
jgi:hypothetical protein